MDVQQVLRMNGGEGDASYAKNSSRQKIVLTKLKPIIEEAIKEVLCATSMPKSMPKSMGVADLGCSSGSNAFFVISIILDAVYEKSMDMGSSPPELQLFLNDLPGNDFNSVFKNVPDFYNKLREKKGDELIRPCFIFGAPGSFYGRIFANRSLHFAFSNIALHWLSQIPPGLENSNKGNICVGKTSPLSAYKAYAEQYRRDFTSFLEMRSQEMISGGRMVLTMASTKAADPFSDECHHLWQYLVDTLNKMVSMGLIEEEKMDSFNLPYYAPYIEELREIIQAQGSFHINQLEEMQLISTANYVSSWNVHYCNILTAKALANHIRAASESVLCAHFGNATVAKLFEMLEEYLSVKLDEGPHIDDYMVVSLTRRE